MPFFVWLLHQSCRYQHFVQVRVNWLTVLREQPVPDTVEKPHQFSIFDWLVSTHLRFLLVPEHAHALPHETPLPSYLFRLTSVSMLHKGVVLNVGVPLPVALSQCVNSDDAPLIPLQPEQCSS